MPLIAAVGVGHPTICVIVTSHRIQCFPGPHIPGVLPIAGLAITHNFESKLLVALSGVGPSSQLLLSACEDGTVSLSDTKSGECMREFVVQPRVACICPFWGTAGEMFVVTGTAEGAASVTCMDGGRNEEFSRALPAPTTAQAHTDFCRTADLVGDGEVVTSCYDGSVRVATGRRVGESVVVSGDWLLATAGDAKGLLFCGFYSGQVSCLSTRDWKEVWMYGNPAWGSIRAIALSRGGLLVGVGTNIGAIVVLHAHSGQLVTVIRPRPASMIPIISLVFLRSLATLFSVDRDGNTSVSRVGGLPVSRITSLVSAIDSRAILETSVLERIAETVTRRIFFYCS